MGRSILSVIAGYLIMVIAIMALFMIWFRGPEATPSGGFMVFSLGYGFVCAGIGGYATAAIAKRREMAHALSLAGFSLLMGIISMFMADGREPLWYQLANMAVMVCAVVLGGHLRARQAMRVK
jgi:peptidoglycan/LPS O-acetylase OafA/YrhL